jgi:hypothetical protein
VVIFFPPKGGVSTTLSPQAIVTGLEPDAEKHCKISFGGYAHIHAEPTPTNDVMVSRTVGGYYRKHTGDLQIFKHTYWKCYTSQVVHHTPHANRNYKNGREYVARLPTNHGRFENYADDKIVVDEPGNEESGYDIGSEIFNVGDLEGVGFHRNEEMINQSEDRSIDDEEENESE